MFATWDLTAEQIGHGNPRLMLFQDANYLVGIDVAGHQRRPTRSHYFCWEAAADTGVHGAQQAALCLTLRRGQGTVDDAQHTLLSHIRAEGMHMRHPVLRGFV